MLGFPVLIIQLGILGSGEGDGGGCGGDGGNELDDDVNSMLSSCSGIFVLA